jgi:hypothetical protein
MNAPRRKKVAELVASGLTPKEAYEATKSPKIVGYRKPKKSNK